MKKPFASSGARVKELIIKVLVQVNNHTNRNKTRYTSQIKAITMKNHIQVQVHLVPTDNQSYIALDGKELCLSKNVEYLSRRMLNNTTKPIPEPQHLYLTSDEEIKEGDWFLLFVSGRFDRFRQCKNVDSSGLIITQFDDGVFSKECRRIVATTNKELREDLIMEEVKDNGKVGKKSLILKISNDFIELYIERYNEGNLLEKVWLEITNRMTYTHGMPCSISEKSGGKSGGK